MTRDLHEAQRTFVELLAQPLVTAATDPNLHRRLVTHHKHLTEASRRLGYRIQHVGRATRLLRLPVAGGVTAPPAPMDAPTRRVLALACLMAAACEEIEGGVTLQRLSDLVAELSTNPGSDGATLSVYDPDQLSHRRALVKAAGVLLTWGVLRRRALADRVEEWAETRSGIGAGYDVDRDALLLFLSPEMLNRSRVVEVDPDTAAATRSIRFLRALVETPAVLYSDFGPADADALLQTRGLRTAEATAMTGGTVETRAEGLVLLLPDDEGRSPVTADWPTAATGSWASLLAADLAGRAGVRGTDGTVHLSDDDVTDLIADLVSWRGHLFSQALRDNPTATRAEVERHLQWLGLLRLTPEGGWDLLPVAARFRDPDVYPPDEPAPAGTAKETP